MALKKFSFSVINCIYLVLSVDWNSRFGAPRFCSVLVLLVDVIVEFPVESASVWISFAAFDEILVARQQESNVFVPNDVAMRVFRRMLLYVTVDIT